MTQILYFQGFEDFNTSIGFRDKRDSWSLIIIIKSLWSKTSFVQMWTITASLIICLFSKILLKNLGFSLYFFFLLLSLGRLITVVAVDWGLKINAPLMHLLLKIFSDCVVNISVILTTSCSITICSGILHQRGLLCVESSCVNTRVSAKETDKSTTSLNNSKLSAIYSSCKLLKPLTALLICVLWLCPVQCV